VSALELLGIQVVSCRDYPGDRPYDVVSSLATGTLGTVLYFNGDTAELNPNTDHDPIVNAALLEDARQHGFIPGAYFVAPRSSSTAADGKAWAEKVSARFAELEPRRGDPVGLNVEKVPLPFQHAAAQRLDELRPHRPILLIVEPYQDNTQNDYAAWLARNRAEPGTRKVAAETYRGNMTPLEVSSVIDYLAKRAIPRELLEPCIDPAPAGLTDWQRAGYYLRALTEAGTRGLLIFQAGRIPR
jgi:predicted amidohydrolase YtcJ